MPRDHWLSPAEREAIIRDYREHPGEEYRRLTYMMLDADIVAVSPATTYRVLGEAGLMRRWSRPPSKNGQGFQQPLAPHEHWHIDIAHLRVAGTFFFLCTVLDGCSRYIVHWELRLQMTVLEVELTVLPRPSLTDVPKTSARFLVVIEPAPGGFSAYAPDLVGWRFDRQVYRGRRGFYARSYQRTPRGA